ncbi:MAG: FKBP-type peptidyl-prolyl cis-trans isomerase [Bacteroidales bacterium]|nr:FKBP-type peptidyl-prolyl cis-trans isomerase [Bacteroidales bacterium]
MRTLFFSILVVIMSISACKEKQVVNQDDIDKQKIINYLEKNNIQAVEDPSGVFYVIGEPGGEAKPILSSTVTVSYDGRLLDGHRFDKGEFFTSRLSSLIQGWQIGITLIGEGGKIKLFIPSTLAYGNKSRPGIPANSVLIFDVDLHYFSN